MFKVYDYNGKNCWVAKEVGKIIGYADNGKKLLDKIHSSWTNSFVENKHYNILSDEELNSFVKSTNCQIQGSRGRKCEKLMILYDKGLIEVLLRTNKQIGKRFHLVANDILTAQFFGTEQKVDVDKKEIDRWLDIEERKVAILEAREKRLSDKKTKHFFASAKDELNTILDQSKKSHDDRLKNQQEQMNHKNKQADQDKLEQIKQKFMKNTRWLSPTKIAKAANIDRWQVGSIAKE
jgi:hypothetical protein